MLINRLFFFPEGERGSDEVITVVDVLVVVLVSAFVSKSSCIFAAAAARGGAEGGGVEKGERATGEMGATPRETRTTNLCFF